MIKEFKSGDGCRFMCTCIPGSTSVFDMDVDDGVEVVEFEGFDDVSIGKVAEKSFPSVKTLVIGEEVECMSIPNEMFPNVRNIISYNRHFLNSDMLIRVDYNMFPDKNGKRTDVWLLNTFCKKPDEVINLKSVEFIDGYAFYGCRSTKIINEDCVKGGFKLAFFGSAFMELEPVGGAYMAGSMIIDVDKDAKELVIPETATYFLHNIHNVTIPDNLVKALVYYGSLKTLRCIYVHIDNANGVYDFVLPDSITSIRNGYSKIALDFNMLANTEYIHNTKRLETAFHYAASSRYECIVAYKTYLKTKHKAAKEFLEKEQYRVAAAIIEELDEKDFVDFVKLRCINLEYDSCIMKRLQEKNWNIALAYMLEEGNGKTKDALVI